MDECYILPVTQTCQWLDGINIPHTEPFVYVPLCLEALASDWIMAPDDPKIPTEFLSILRRYGVDDDVAIDLSKTGLTSIRNDLYGLKLDRRNLRYSVHVESHHGLEGSVYHINVFPYKYSEYEPSVHERRRRMAAQQLATAMSMYMNACLIEDPTEAFSDFISKRPYL